MWPQGVLLDFDGVIADTEPSNAAYLAAALRRFGVELTEAERLALVGVSDKTTLERLLSRAKTPVSPAALAEERRRCGNTYADSASLRPQPGLREWLDSLRAHGVATAVVSSTRTQLIVTALNRMQLLHSFDVVVCGDMVQTPKPAPDSYRLALKWLGLEAGQCLAVEDSPTGLQAAKAAGLQVVGYTGGSIRQDTSRADWTAASFDAIARLLETLAPNDGRTAK